jgi:hypothetical protein
MGGRGINSQPSARRSTLRIANRFYALFFDILKYADTVDLTGHRAWLARGISVAGQPVLPTLDYVLGLRVVAPCWEYQDCGPGLTSARFVLICSRFFDMRQVFAARNATKRLGTP